MITEEQMLKPLDPLYNPFDERFATRKVTLLTDNKLEMTMRQLEKILIQ